MTLSNRPLRVASLLALACCCAPSIVPGQVVDMQQHYEHEFPPTLVLKADLIDYERDPTPRAIQSLLRKDAPGKHVVRAGERFYTSVWVTIDRWLKQHPEMLAKLRISQNAEAARELFSATISGDSNRVTSARRTFPWAEAVHESLVEAGERALRAGQAQRALRNFQDVLDRSEKAAVRDRAQVGLWLAKAHTADTVADIEGMFREVDMAARYPWLGEQLSAKEIQAKLIAGMKPAAAFPALSALDIRTLQLPDDPPWMGTKGRLNVTNHAWLFRHKVEPVIGDQGTVVAGPCLVARYEGGTLDAPAWSKVATMDISTGGQPTPPFAPLIADGMIVVRCGSDLAPSDQKRTREIGARHGAPHGIRFLDQLAAFDQQSGQKIWSTGDDPDWSDLFVVNAPVYSDGRLYMLALPSRKVKPGRSLVLIGGKSPIFLVIAQARTGRLLHQRELVAYHTQFQRANPADGETTPPRTFRKLNLAADAERRGQFFTHNELNRYGNRLTVQDGAVYVSTAMGAAARCDARDGSIEWVATYPQLRVNSTGVLVPTGWTHVWDAPYTIRGRQGIAPLVSDGMNGNGVVVFSPRDTVAVFALDRETGEMLWQKKEIKDADAKSGKLVSNAKPADQPLDAHVLDGSLEAVGLLGDLVLVTFDRKIAALDVATGKVRWTKELDRPVERPIKVVDRALYVATATDLHQIDCDTGKIVGTRAFAPLRADNGFVFDDKGLIVVRAGARGITYYGDGPLPELKAR